MEDEEEDGARDYDGDKVEKRSSGGVMERDWVRNNAYIVRSCALVARLMS